MTVAYGQYYTSRADGVGEFVLRLASCWPRTFERTIQAIADVPRTPYISHIGKTFMSDITRRSRTSCSRLLACVALGVVCSTAGSAQATAAVPRIKEDKPGLLARAHVTPDSARALARGRVPAAQIAAAEIEMEKGKLVYSFDMKTRGRGGIDEVLIDAMTGAVISVAHEGPAQEAAERAQDARDCRAKRDSTRRP